MTDGPSDGAYEGKTTRPNVCANCGKKHPHLIWWDGQWWCPGACLVNRKKPKGDS
jgi:hypothetical protein